MKHIHHEYGTPTIAQEQWEQAKSATLHKYAHSTSLPYVIKCLQTFEQTNTTKYRNDFMEFVFESSVEDFCDTSDADVVVSTIHKAKGREFDDVYLLIKDRSKKDDELRRQYYVGLTRAKNRLFIHTNSHCFDMITTDRSIVDQKLYNMPEEVVLQPSHKDVNLGYFKSRKEEVLSLQGGDELTYADYTLFNPKTGRSVARLSVEMQQRIMKWKELGYTVKSASVRFIVAWKPKDAPKDESETAVLLPDLVLARQATDN